jgi:hypothetical protein
MPGERDAMPERLRLSRKRGFKLPPGTIKVDRTSIWGNPYRPDAPSEAATAAGALTAADAFRLWITGHPGLADEYPEKRAAILANISKLRGRDLACWCPPGSPCHADVLIELANADPEPKT